MFYKMMYVVGFAIMMVINLKTYRRYRLDKTKTIIITLITYVAGVSGALLIGKIYSAVMRANGLPDSSSVAIFGAVIFTPIFMTIAALLLKQNWRRVLDMLAPGIYIILACAKLGCLQFGCCHGLPCEFGIYNSNLETTVFPIQAVEVVLMSLIIAFCFWYAFKSDKYVIGTVYPATSILYCFIRFFVEYFRYYEVEEQRHVVFGMTMWQFCCIVVAFVSVVWILVSKSEKVKAHDKKLLDNEEEILLKEIEIEKLQKRIKRQKKKHKKK